LQAGLPTVHDRRDGSDAEEMSEGFLAFRPGIVNRDSLREAAVSAFST